MAVGELKGQSRNKKTASFINEALPRAGERTEKGRKGHRRDRSLSHRPPSLTSTGLLL